MSKSGPSAKSALPLPLLLHCYELFELCMSNMHARWNEINGFSLDENENENENENLPCPPTTADSSSRWPTITVPLASFLFPGLIAACVCSPASFLIAAPAPFPTGAPPTRLFPFQLALIEIELIA